MSESVEVQEESEEKRAELEDVLYRNEQYQDLNNKRWSKAVVKDVEIFKSYVFRNISNDPVGNKFESTETFTTEDSAKEAFRNVYNGEDAYSKVEWRRKPSFHMDGSFEFKGKEYEYEKKHMAVVTVGKSEDRGHEQKIIVSKMGEDAISTYDRISKMSGRSVLIGKSSFDGLMMKIDDTSERGKRVTLTERSKVMAAGFIGCFGLASIFSPILLSNLDPMASMGVLSVFLGIGLLGTMFHSYSRTDGLYSARERDWLYELPKSSVVQGLDKNGQIADCFEMKTGEVKAYDNGDVVVETENDKWTFEGDKDGTPNNDVDELFDEYGIDMMEGNIDVAVAENREVLDRAVKSGYESDSGRSLLMTRNDYDRSI